MASAQAEKIVPESSQFFYVKFCKFLKRDIEADYLATNLYKQKEADAEIINIQKILPPDCPPDVAVYMTKYTWLAHIEYLQHFYNLIEENHGSIQIFFVMLLD